MDTTINPPLNNNEVYKPVLLRLNNQSDREKFSQIVNEDPFVFNEIKGQLSELIKSQHPSVKLKPEMYEAAINQHLNGVNIHDYGVWVYYPWNKRLVHLLDKEEFIAVRTNRNQYKITNREREILSTKKIGIIGLSVGQSIALTLAMERGCGELRLADFDSLELSNLNRIRTGVHNLGVPKVVIAAREIAEMDPFIKVTCFFEGLTESNMDNFFSNDGKLDIVVDECDGLDVKILARFKARELGIPVIMDTSDRGMLDIERFDLEPERPILHGMAEGLNPLNIKKISNEDKVPIVLQMLGVGNISVRAKASMIEVEQSINTWPQLASSVALGGAAGADTCRRILLDQLHVSGRFYIDFEQIIQDPVSVKLIKQSSSDSSERKVDINPYSPLDSIQMLGIAHELVTRISNSVDADHISTINDLTNIKLTDEQIEQLVSAACAAPSTGNDQPWKWLYHKGILFLFHDRHRSFSFGDFRGTASFISFGAAYENLNIHALKMGLKAHLQYQDQKDSPLVAFIYFSHLNEQLSKENQLLQSLDGFINQRFTNRTQSTKIKLDESLLNGLSKMGETIKGAKVRFFTEEHDIHSLGQVIGFCDRVRLLDVNGHFDFVHREMRWTEEQTKQMRDGIDIQTLGLTGAQLAALNVIKSEEVIKTLNALNGGKAMEMLADRTVKSASALCLITVPVQNNDTKLDVDLFSYFMGGRAMERFWLDATRLNIAIHPLISPLYLFSRLINGQGEGLDPAFIEQLGRQHKRFLEITGIDVYEMGVFLAKMAIAPEPTIKSLRLPLKETLILA
ncbi:Rv1355c family protein [Arachidicoccus ginsenosidivorans]|uniref:Rv1355c family protein n=1 Tax=Arachidicoccus ginsenosidivorans TaxID=496057 RepID=A0A5B8VRB2_9BACT|nr:Rv1355c family protein [Arachidicoccus ginsenosidivorans]QEC73969.1 Rv1355c family protein [Arachidicoccus ginsenosidivorans]